MPGLKRFANCTVYIYGEDHNPPHVHIRGPDFLLLVEIGGKGRIVGRTGKARGVEEAIAWVTANSAELLDMWKELNP